MSYKIGFKTDVKETLSHYLINYHTKCIALMSSVDYFINTRHERQLLQYNTFTCKQNAHSILKSIFPNAPILG